MPEPVPQENICNEMPLAQELFELLKTVDHRKTVDNTSELPNPRSKETQLSQAKCLRLIQSRLIDESYAHLLSVYETQKAYTNRRIETGSLLESDSTMKFTFNDVTILEGYINELLGRAKIEESRPELITPETDQNKRKENIILGEKILEIAHQPERFGLELFGKNPDAEWVNVYITDNGRVICEIGGPIEFTTGRLDKRKFLQLGKDGYLRNFKNLCHIVNTLTNPEEHGLGEFGVNGMQIEISKNYKQYLVLARDSDITPNGLRNSLKKVIPDDQFGKTKDSQKKFYLSQTESDKFIELLTDSSQTEILKGDFTNKEVRAIAENIIEKIKKAHPSYQTSQQ